MDIFTLVNSSQYAHSRQVAKISGLLAQSAGYSADEISIIVQAASFHDVGKIAVPPEILNKPDPLTPAEYEIVKTHTAIGHQQIIKAGQTLAISAAVCREHHERLDGFHGYLGLTGNNIHPYAKLIAVADVLDALVSKRPYKEPWNISAITTYFSEQAGKQFDTGIVSLLLSIMDQVLLLYNEDTVQEDK